MVPNVTGANYSARHRWFMRIFFVVPAAFNFLGLYYYVGEIDFKTACYYGGYIIGAFLVVSLAVEGGFEYFERRELKKQEKPSEEDTGSDSE